MYISGPLGPREGDRRARSQEWVSLSVNGVQVPGLQYSILGSIFQSHRHYEVGARSLLTPQFEGITPKDPTQVEKVLPLEPLIVSQIFWPSQGNRCPFQYLDFRERPCVFCYVDPFQCRQHAPQTSLVNKQSNDEAPSSREGKGVMGGGE